MFLALAIAALLLSALPTLMFFRNLGPFCEIDELGDVPTGEIQDVSVLIPARDEAGSIEKSVSAALQSKGVNVEVIVLDDQSTDATAQIVRDIAKSDDRVRLVTSIDLPPNWNGKQFACKQLSEQARHPFLLFIDADVQLHPDAIAKLIRRYQATHVGLLSAFPRQVTGTWLEKWMIPMMHFILLGYLPFDRMRTHGDASLAAGCGQLFLTTTDAYQQAGTHAAIANSRHDGVKLPRAYREQGMMTDVVDGTQLATCRMYENARQVIRGLLKNASEGIANPRLIGPFSVLLLGCSLLPAVALIVAIVNQQIAAILISAVAVILCHVPRVVAAVRLKQSWLGALCHVPATVGFVFLQWVALANHLMGRQVAWRGRIDSSAG